MLLVAGVISTVLGLVLEGQGGDSWIEVRTMCSTHQSCRDSFAELHTPELCMLLGSAAAMRAYRHTAVRPAGLLV